MTSRGANNAVLLGTVVTLGSTTGYSLTSSKHLPTAKTVVGGLFAMTGCAVLTEFDANLGGYLAIAVAGTAFFLYGLPTLEHYFTNSETPTQRAGLKKSEKSIKEHGGYPTQKENEEVLRHAERGEAEKAPGVYIPRR